MADLSSVKALTFDVGGTVLDWHTGIAGHLAAFGERKGIEAPWPDVTNSWRRKSLTTMIGEREGALAEMNIDGVHRHVLEEVLREFGVDARYLRARANAARGTTASPLAPRLMHAFSLTGVRPAATAASIPSNTRPTP